MRPYQALLVVPTLAALLACSSSDMTDDGSNPPPAVGNAVTVSKSNRMFGRSCVNCHSNIHGSNHPSGQSYMR